jgi:hypothetical protein
MSRTKLSPSRSKCLEIAARQHGLVTREQALGAGMAPWTITDELARGTWRQRRPGVYRTADAPETWRQRALALCIGPSPAFAVSHRSAAFLHGLLPAPPEPLEADGYAYHSDPDSFDYDRARGNVLLTQGWRVLRTTDREVRRYPERLVAALRETLGARVL